MIVLFKTNISHDLIRMLNVKNMVIFYIAQQTEAQTHKKNKGIECITRGSIIFRNETWHVIS